MAAEVETMFYTREKPWHNWMKVFDLYKEIPNESYRILFWRFW